MPTASKMVLAGDLGLFDRDWTGWIIREGKLISPEGWEATPGNVLATRLHAAQLAVYQAENRRLKAELAEAAVNKLEEQPRPEDWDVQILAG